MLKQQINQDYESPKISFFLLEELNVVCTSGSGKTEDFDDIEDFEW